MKQVGHLNVLLGGSGGDEAAAHRPAPTQRLRGCAAAPV